MEKHTKLPWWAGSDDDAHMVYAGDAHTVEAVADCGRDDGDYHAEEANAALIARAVNTHSALLAAAVKVRAGIDAVIRAGGNVPVIDGIADLHKAICDAGGAKS